MIMNYVWNSINTVLIFLLFVYLLITKDINTKAYEKAFEVEKRVDNQDKIIDVVSTQKDTVVINMNWSNSEKYYKTNNAIK